MGVSPAECGNSLGGYGPFNEPYLSHGHHRYRNRRGHRRPADRLDAGHVTSAGLMAMLPVMLENDPKQAGWSVGQSAWRLGISIREYRELEAWRTHPDGW